MQEMNKQTCFEPILIKDYHYTLGGDFNAYRFLWEKIGDIVQLYKRYLIVFPAYGVNWSSFILVIFQ